MTIGGWNGAATAGDAASAGGNGALAIGGISAYGTVAAVGVMPGGGMVAGTAHEQVLSYFIEKQFIVVCIYNQQLPHPPDGRERLKGVDATA
jgi:hypothetical protein